MAKFYYRAKDNNKKLTSGYINALSISDAAIKLEQKGLIVLEINEEMQSVNVYSTYSNNNSISEKYVFKIKEKLEFFNSFYFMYKSGLSVSQIFASMYSESRNPIIRGLCSNVSKKIEKGKTLEEAFQGYSNALGIAYTSLIVAGEHSGKLDVVLLNIIKNIKREQEIKGNLISSLTYPAFVLALALFVFLLFKFCLLKIYSMMGQGLSFCAIKNIFIVGITKIVIIFGALIGAIIFVLKNRIILKKVIDFICTLPFFSGLIKNYSFANFFSVMGLAYASGIPAYKTVELANSVVISPDIKKNVANAVRMITKGCEITTAFGVARVFSSFAMSQISAGEKAGELDKMCAVISENYEKELELSISVMMKLLQPITIVLIAIIVGYILVQAYTTYYGALFNALSY